jgi:hypothetical protein
MFDVAGCSPAGHTVMFQGVPAALNRGMFCEYATEHQEVEAI